MFVRKSVGDCPYIRAVVRSENPGVPLVEIGLTDLPKSGCAMAQPAHLGTTPLYITSAKGWRWVGGVRKAAIFANVQFYLC